MSKLSYFYSDSSPTSINSIPIPVWFRKFFKFHTPTSLRLWTIQSSDNLLQNTNAYDVKFTVHTGVIFGFDFKIWFQAPLHSDSNSTKKRTPNPLKLQKKKRHTPTSGLTHLWFVGALNRFYNKFNTNKINYNKFNVKLAPDESHNLETNVTYKLTHNNYVLLVWILIFYPHI